MFLTFNDRLRQITLLLVIGFVVFLLLREMAVLDRKSVV